MKKVVRNKSSKKGFNSISRASSILIHLCAGNNTITDISDKSGISKATVHRLLKSMETVNMVISDPLRHRYYLGSLLHQLTSNPATSHEYLISYALSEMEHLFDISHETVVLDVLIGYKHMLLHEIPSENILKVTEGGPGTRPLLSVGAVSKVLISQLNGDELKSILKGIKDRNQKLITETEKELLLAELKRVRQEGYAITHGEGVVGVIGIAAPVTNYVFPAAIGILCPETRLMLDVPTLITEIKQSAIRISEHLAKLQDIKP